MLKDKQASCASQAAFHVVYFYLPFMLFVEGEQLPLPPPQTHCKICPSSQFITGGEKKFCSVNLVQFQQFYEGIA